LSDQTFSGRRGVSRTALAVASSGLLLGVGAATVGPASAATASDCNGSNTLVAGTNPVGDIQALLDADTPTICLSGTFVLTAPLTFDHELSLFGIDGAVLDGNDSVKILTGSSPSLTVQNLSFVNGYASSFEYGGAIFMTSGVLTVEDSVFSSNYSANSAGAIYTTNATIVRSEFSDNEAAREGGAIYSRPDGYLDVVDSTFDGNMAQVGGAIRSYRGTTVVAVRSTFVGNSASANGGAITSYSYAGSVNSTFVGNSAGTNGGAISIAPEVDGFTGRAEVFFSTFLDNEAVDQGDAIHLENSGQPSSLGGNIFAGSRPFAQVRTDGPDVEDEGGNVFTTSESSEADLGISQASTLFSQSVSSIFGTNPALADNGGATETVALVCESPALDAVPTTTVAAVSIAETPYSVVSDQRQVTRTGLFDAGAYEGAGCAVKPDELAETGPADVSLVGWFAAALVGLGSLALIGKRRRRVRHGAGGRLIGS
jgi:hypothetical protein